MMKAEISEIIVESEIKVIFPKKHAVWWITSVQRLNGDNKSAL